MPKFEETLGPDSDQEFITVIGDRTIRINKVGGGTLGRSYSDEYWEYEVARGSIILSHGTDMFISGGATHLTAAILADWGSY